jgi:Ca2+-binding RTX toxin-like protein
MLVRGEFTKDIGDVSFNRIENFSFADGTVLTWDQVLQGILNRAQTPTNGTVYGTDYADVIDPGPGNHYLSGRNGSDTYVFGHGYGHDTIDAGTTKFTSEGTSSVQFKADVAPADVTWTVLGNDLVARLNNSNDSLTILGAFGAQAVGSFKFSDGTTLSLDAVRALATTAPTVTGTTGDDVITAGPADAVLSGGTGNDTYVYLRGDGFDRIVTGRQAGSGAVDTLSFPDIASTDVKLLRWPGQGLDDLVISIDAKNGLPQDQITIAGQFAYGGNPADSAIQRIVFADGVVWTEADIGARLIAQEEAQTAPGPEIDGFGGNDTLTALAGASTLVGGTGADTYVWSAGDGPTWIRDEGTVDGASHSAIDTLKLQGVDPAAVTVTRSPEPGSHDLILTIAGQSPIVLVNQTAAESADVIERVVFDNGTVWDASDLALKADGGIATALDGVTARAFDGSVSVLTGTASNDTYFWGAGHGNGTIVEGSVAPWQKADSVRMVGLNPSDVHLGIRQENSHLDLVITDKATGETLNIVGQFDEASRDGSDTWPGAGTGIEHLVFADGTVWTPEQILDHSGYVASPGSDTVTNFGLGDGTLPIEAAPGVRALIGRSDEANTYLWQAGIGDVTIDHRAGSGLIDTLRLQGVGAADLAVFRKYNDLLVRDGATGETVKVLSEFPSNGSGTGIGRIVLDDGTGLGTVLDRAWIDANAHIETFTFVGTASNTQLVGNSDDVNNIFVLGPGGDIVVFGARATNTIVFGSGIGNAVAKLNGETGTVRMASGIAPSDVILEADPAGDLAIELRSTGDSLTIKGDLWQTINGTTHSIVSTVAFADGGALDLTQPLTFTWIGTESNTTLTGTGFGSNVFDLGPGGDTVTLASNGNNTIVFDEGDGQATVNLNGGSGSVRIADDIAASDVFLQANTSGNLTIGLRDTSDTLTIKGDLYHTISGATVSNLARINFDDGSAIDLNQPLTFTWIGTAANTTLTGSAFGNNVFDLGPGGDTVTAVSSDTNTFVFDKGDGQATINLNGGSGSVRIADDIAASDVYLQANASGDLTIGLRDTSDTLTIKGDLYHTISGFTVSNLGRISFGDGSAIDLTKPLTLTWVGTATHTVLTGSTWGTNIFDLGPGGDTVTEVTANDVVVFDRGDGQAKVTLAGGGTLKMASDVAPADVILQADSAGDLTVKLRDTADSVTFNNDLVSNSWGVSSRVSQIAFADGTVMALGQPSSGQGQPLTFTWPGAPGIGTLTGSSWGSNVFEYASADGNLTINNPGGAGGTLMLTNVTSAGATLSRTGNDLLITMTGANAVTIKNEFNDAAAVPSIRFADGGSVSVGATALTWTGVAGSTLVGSNYATNTFVFGGGAETAVGGTNASGGTGNNTYQFGAQSGQATIVVNGNTGTNELDFGSGIADTNLWFKQSGNDLQIDLIGTNPQVTISGWYAGSANQLQEITAQGLRLDNQIGQLVQAMAAYSTSNPGFDPTQATQMPADPVLQGAIAAAWHMGGGSGFSARFFALPFGPSHLADVNWNAVPTYATTAAQISGTPDSVWTASPHVNYAADYQANLSIATAGTYGFSLNSDDGSALYIDGALVVNDDGAHGAVTVSGQVALTAGTHAVEVRYFQAGGGQTLTLTAPTGANGFTIPATAGTTIFSGAYGSYRFATDAANDLIVTDTRSGSPDGTSTLAGMLRLSFIDRSVNVITGTSGADALVGSAGNDIFIGGGGNDTFTGNGGRGRGGLFGGAGELRFCRQRSGADGCDRHPQRLAGRHRHSVGNFSARLLGSAGQPDRWHRRQRHARRHGRDRLLRRRSRQPHAHRQWRSRYGVLLRLLCELRIGAQRRGSAGGDRYAQRLAGRHRHPVWDLAAGVRRPNRPCDQRHLRRRHAHCRRQHRSICRGSRQRQDHRQR